MKKSLDAPQLENGWWMKKMWHIYTLEYYSVVKKYIYDILNFASKWMELENTILSEVAQTQKDGYGMY